MIVNIVIIYIGCYNGPCLEDNAVIYRDVKEYSWGKYFLKLFLVTQGVLQKKS